ncbi:hypothetical protein ACLBWT_19550 [Paenibacillus sp. D51F]
MDYNTTTQGTLYLLSLMEFDLDSGSPVLLYGDMEVSTGKELIFTVPSRIPCEPSTLHSESITTSVDDPLGMTGVRLNEFKVSARIYKLNGSVTADTTFKATATFPSLDAFTLSGLILFEASSPRLVRVELSADPQLTLTDFITKVIGGSWDWADEVTNQFAFKRGALYALKPPPDAHDNYTYSYKDPENPSQTIKLNPGYYAEAFLTIFGNYDFAVSLGVKEKTFKLTARSLQPFDFDFFVLKDAVLEICSTAGDKYFKLDTCVVIMNTPIARVSASYDLSQSAFVGSVRVPLHYVELPTGNGSSSQEVTLDIEFTWTRGTDSNSGFHISKLNGLPSNTVDWIKDYLSVLNSGDNCRKIESDWLDGLTETSLKPELNGSPRKNDSGLMEIPLKLNYTIKAGGSKIANNEITFTVMFAIPASVHDLPNALWTSLVSNSQSVIGEMLQQEDTYKAIAEYAALKGGASAVARFICRALAKGLEKLAKALAEAAKNLVKGTLAELAELAAALAAVALLGIPALISGLADLFEELWDWLTGKDEEKERQANEQLDAARQKIQDAIDKVMAVIRQVKSNVQVQGLIVGIAPNGDYYAEWKMGGEPGGEAVIQYNFQLLQGEIGSQSPIWDGTTIKVCNKLRYDVPFDSIPRYEKYGMNASVNAVVKNLTFIYPDTVAGIKVAIDQLAGIDNDKAKEYADDLRCQLEQLKSYNTNGVITDTVYAKVAIPDYMTIGQSRIGQNTRIP